MSVSTKSSERVCFSAEFGRGGYCGRTSAPIKPMNEATCADCHAAWRADEAAAKRKVDK